MFHRHAARRNVALLALCQGLTMSSNALVITTAALVGQQLAPAAGLATLPLGLQYVAIMATTIPASLLMKRIGRRDGFSVGAIAGVTAGVTGCAAILLGSFPLFCLAAALHGVFSGFGLFYRFAAADAADEAFRSRAISYTLAGGVIAAVAGPELAKATRDLLAPVLFAGCFLAVAGLGLAVLVVLRFVTIPRPGGEERRASGRPLGRIARQPAFVVAALAAMVAYGTMALVMTATPLAMVACGLGFNDAALVIQWHVLGMYAPSFVTGRLVDRFGAPAMIAAGAGLILACVAVNLGGVELIRFWAALVLLGVGWNLMFVGATTLLTSTYGPAEKAKVQALNDFLMFGTVAAASLSSGALQQLVGWTAVNGAVVAPVLLALAATLWLLRRRRDEAAARRGPAAV